MRVLAVTPMYPPVSLVGAWLTTHELLKGLVERGHEVRSHSYMRPCRGQLDGVSLVPEPSWAWPDVVVSHMGDNQAAARQAGLSGVPSVRMAHAATPVPAERLAGCSLLVCNSNATKAAIGWDGPTIVVPPPVWPERYRTTPGAKVTLVNMSRPKGADMFRRLAHSLPHRQFLGVRGGYGSQRPVSAPNVTTIDTTLDMRDVYSQTRILLVPSLEESWGRVGVEAMCSGIPVVATPTAGLAESLGPAGVFAAATDLGAWRTHIERLHDPAEWAAQSDRCLARSAELDPAADVARFCDAMDAVMAAA